MRGETITEARQLADLGRGPEEPPEPAVLDLVVGAAAPLLRSMAHAGQELVLALGAPGARVALGRGSIERVLMNLVTNALDASQPGDVIRIGTAAVRGTDCTYGVLRVSDQGHGIDETTRPLIFEPYFTTRRDSGGCGLGLAIVHATVQRAGGFVDVESEPGRGTTFAVHLPVTAG